MMDLWDVVVATSLSLLCNLLPTKSLQNHPSLSASHIFSSLEPHTVWLDKSKTNSLQFPGSSWNHYLFSKRVAFNSSVGESLAFISPSLLSWKPAPWQLGVEIWTLFSPFTMHRKDWDNFRAGGNLPHWFALPLWRTSHIEHANQGSVCTALD